VVEEALPRVVEEALPRVVEESFPGGRGGRSEAESVSRPPAAGMKK
jgi:hypothetical protein